MTDCNSDWYRGIERGKIIERANSIAFPVGYALGVFSSILVAICFAVLT